MFSETHYEGSTFCLLRAFETSAGCLCLLNAGITGQGHQAWLRRYLVIQCISIDKTPSKLFPKMYWRKVVFERFRSKLHWWKLIAKDCSHSLQHYFLSCILKTAFKKCPLTENSHDQNYTLKYVRNFHLPFILILTATDDSYLSLSFDLFQKLLWIHTIQHYKCKDINVYFSWTFLMGNNFSFSKV